MVSGFHRQTLDFYSILNQYEISISLNMILEYDIPRLMVYTIISEYDNWLHLKMLSWHQKICLETYIITATGTNNIFL